MKTEAGNRDIPLIPQLEQIMKRWFLQCGHEKYLFLNKKGRRLQSDRWTKFMFPRILEEAGIKRIKFHELRHTFGTMLNTLGVPPALIKAYMGHESINTTIDLYCHPTEKQKVEGIRFFGEAIDRLSVEKSVEKHSI